MIEKNDYDKIERDLTTLIAKVGKPIFYVSFSGDMRTPTDDEREWLKTGGMRILQHVETMDLVLEGESIGLSLLRAIFRAMIVAMRKNDRVFIVGSLAQSLARLESRVGVSAAEVLRRAKAEKII